jgi:hypothetical protein
MAVPEPGTLLDRLAGGQKWIRKNQVAVGVASGLAVAAIAGGMGWAYWQDQVAAQASFLFSQGIADEHGHVSSKAEGSDDDTTSRDLYPTFATATERHDAALAKYRTVESKFPGTGAAILARLAEATLLLDAGDAKGALRAYADVEASPLAKADRAVRGRAVEGQGFADEFLARTDEEHRSQHLDDALARYKAMQAIEIDDFKNLGIYHEARVRAAKGDKPKAIELLKDLSARLGESSRGTSYLKFVVEDQLRDLDPSALPPKPPKGAAGPGGLDMNDPRIQKLLREYQDSHPESPAPARPGAPPPIPRPGPGPGSKP